MEFIKLLYNYKHSYYYGSRNLQTNLKEGGHLNPVTLIWAGAGMPFASWDSPAISTR